MNNLITHPVSNQIEEPDNYEKGRRFEQYIINLFNDQHFLVKEYRMSKKFAEGNLPSNYFLPDIELIFMGRRNYKFAVECKWKETFKNDKIGWADQKKIDIYKKFQSDEKAVVFIAIGIGGEPSNPEKLFVTPLDMICNKPWITESDLLKYKRKPTRRFFYDTVQLRLW